MPQDNLRLQAIATISVSIYITMLYPIKHDITPMKTRI